MVRDIWRRTCANVNDSARYYQKIDTIFVFSTIRKICYKSEWNQQYRICFCGIISWVWYEVCHRIHFTGTSHWNSKSGNIAVSVRDITHLTQCAIETICAILPTFTLYEFIRSLIRSRLTPVWGPYLLGGPDLLGDTHRPEPGTVSQISPTFTDILMASF